MPLLIDFVVFTLLPIVVLVVGSGYCLFYIYESGDYRPSLLVVLLSLMTFHQTLEVLAFASGTFSSTMSPMSEALETGANLLASLGSFFVVKQVDELRSTRRELEASNAALTERNSMLSVLNRVLRHNVRNDISVIVGRAEQLQHAVDDEYRPALETIEETALDIADISARTQRIRSLLSEETTDSTPLSLAASLETSLNDVRETSPDATISLTVPGDDDLVVDGPSSLPQAIGDVVEQVIAYNDGTACVHVTVTTDHMQNGSGDRAVVVRIDDDGDGLPSSDVRVLDAGEETPLRHGDGLALWCLEWAVERADGEIDMDPDDATVEIRLRRRSAEIPG